MNALKAQWVVRAGLIPHDEMPEYTQVWQYTSDDYKRDGGTPEGRRAAGSRYMQCCVEAHRHAKQLEAGGLNWVTVEYLWL